MGRIRRLLGRVVRALTDSLVRAVPGSLAAPVADAALRARLRLLERVRRADAKRGQRNLPAITSYAGERLEVSILEQGEPWRSMPLDRVGIPGMLTSAERQYYSFITRFYSGAGEVVELGTWLGLSTHFIVMGLSKNPMFRGKLHCVDDFVWRSSWMDKWISGIEFAPPANHASFQHDFERAVGPVRDRLVVHRARFAEYDGNDRISTFEWAGGPIEMCFVDCGRQLHVNEAWYRELRPHFLPDRTLLILQDWQQHKAVPEVWWENMKIFTDSKEGELQLVHEVRDGAVGTFLFRGSR